MKAPDKRGRIRLADGLAGLIHLRAQVSPAPPPPTRKRAAPDAERFRPDAYPPPASQAATVPESQRGGRARLRPAADEGDFRPVIPSHQAPRPARTAQSSLADRATLQHLGSQRSSHAGASSDKHIAPDQEAAHAGSRRPAHASLASKSAKTAQTAGNTGSHPPKQVNDAAPTLLSNSDIALFRRAVAQSTPIRDTRRAILPPVPTGPPEILRERRQRAMGSKDTPAPLTVSDAFHPAAPAGDESRFVRDRHGPDLLKGLRQGKWPIGASLDLHGNTLDQARDRFDRFLQSCLEHQIRCVRIVHGKGYGSRDGEPVLKQAIRRWLRQLDAVQAYGECAEHDGGAGAVQVLLRSNQGQAGSPKAAL